MALTSPFGRGYRILSRPVKVNWLGWETDTLTLQQAGWELSAEQDISRGSMRLAIRHQLAAMEGITEVARWDYERIFCDASSGAPSTRHLQMRALTHHIVIHDHGEMKFGPIDAAPSMVSSRVSRLEDLAHFPQPLVRTQAIVLPEKSVDDLLKEVLERQADAKTAYFKDLVAEEGKMIPPHRFHAQIISLRDAA